MVIGLKSLMNPGDLVKKVKGYGADKGWTGVVLEHVQSNVPGDIPKIIVLTEEGVEWWYVSMVEVICES